jgi:hypothetical protein
LPSASAPVVRAPFDRSQENPPCDHATRPTLPRPPHPIPTFVTMANAPLSERDGDHKQVIWVKRETKYFCEQGWTGQIRLNRLDKLDFWRNGFCTFARSDRARVECRAYDGWNEAMPID